MNVHIMPDVIGLLAEGKDLTRDSATRAFQVIMNGGATPAQMAAFLMALRLKGETIDEITGGALAMRAKAQHIKAPKGTIDTCGTGGDAKGTYNISTATAFVLAACDVPVAKHGNRSVSSLSGSADVLTYLGVNVNAETPVVQRCLDECNIAFLMAPRFHPAMRHVAPVRQELGIRTIFNLLGPLSNPAAPDYQLVGVYSKDWVEPLAHALKELGVKAAWVVHGADGLDELTLSGPTSVAELKDGKVRVFESLPGDAGVIGATIDEIRGKTPEYNAHALLHALSGAESAYRRAVLYNSAAGLMIAGKAANLKEGVVLAKEAIDSGKAHSVLKKLAEISNERP